MLMLSFCGINIDYALVLQAKLVKTVFRASDLGNTSSVKHQGDFDPYLFPPYT